MTEHGCKPLCEYHNLMLEPHNEYMSCIECGLSFTEHDMFEKLHETWDKSAYPTLAQYVASYMKCSLGKIPKGYYMWIIKRDKGGLGSNLR